MEFELDADQRDLQDTIQGIVAKECPSTFVREVIDAGADPSPWWQTMVGLYWPALAIEEAHGGLGLTWVELGILVEELGRATDPSPFLATTTQFVPAVRECGSDAQAAAWLGAVAAGSITGAVAFAESTVTATPVDGGWRLTGRAADVVDGDRADEIVVVATAPDGVAAFVVNRAAAVAAGSLTIDSIPVFDQTTHVAHLGLDGVAVTTDRRLAGADVPGGVTRAYEEATLGWAVSTVGACQRIIDLVVPYVKERHQFGVPIGSFQAVKHKAVDVFVSIQRARALAQFAALTIVENDPRRSIAISMAKAAAGDCQDISFRHGFQLFGGMGYTWENDLQFALRRAKLGAVMFGSTSSHRRRVAQEVLVK